MTTVDVACGDAPRGDLNLDIRATDHVDVQADCRALPLADDAVDELVAVDVLEHLRWDVVDETLCEWRRVLEPGGVLWIRTPDLAWICANYDSIPPRRLQRKLFGGATSPIDAGEAYPENRHRCLFTPVLLGDVLEAAGFVDVVVNTDLPAPNHWNQAARAVAP